MKNPWVSLPHKEPFVLPEERPTISRFNEKCKRADQQIHLEVPPNPYFGNPSSQIVLLSLNPGFDSRDYESYVSNPDYLSSHRKMLLHEEQEYPFVPLNPKFSHTPGFDYFEGRLRRLIEWYDRKTISNKLFWIEYFPYPSRTYRQLGQLLPSQEYAFYLVSQAVERGATIIVMRNKCNWLKAVPKLAKYEIHELNSPRAGSISPRNAPSAIKAIQKILG